jgi:hypothetical protein
MRFLVFLGTMSAGLYMMACGVFPLFSLGYFFGGLIFSSGVLGCILLMNGPIKKRPAS